MVQMRRAGKQIVTNPRWEAASLPAMDRMMKHCEPSSERYSGVALMVVQRTPLTMKAFAVLVVMVVVDKSASEVLVVVVDDDHEGTGSDVAVVEFVVLVHAEDVLDRGCYLCDVLMLPSWCRCCYHHCSPQKFQQRKRIVFWG